MPTNQNGYNSRVTDEALEKRFRDTFTSQGGAELVSDLYASGVIVPIVDFTAAAEGSALRSDLQTAWDFSTGHSYVSNATTTIINTTGFWQIDLVLAIETNAARTSSIKITDGLSSKVIWQYDNRANTNFPTSNVAEDKFIVFVRAGDSVTASTNGSEQQMNIWYRQIADVSGNFTNPLGFTSS